MAFFLHIIPPHLLSIEVINEYGGLVAVLRQKIVDLTHLI